LDKSTLSIQTLFPTLSGKTFSEVLEAALSFVGTSPIDVMEKEHIDLLYENPSLRLNMSKVQDDVAALQACDYSLLSLISDRILKLRSTTLQPIDLSSPLPIGLDSYSASELQLYNDIACQGLPLFNTDLLTPRFNSSCAQSSSAITTAMIVSQNLSLGKIIVLPTSVVQNARDRHNTPVHSSDAFAIPKSSGTQGRLIVNYSAPINNAINHPDYKDGLAALYGDIEHVSMAEICDIILRAIDLSPDGSILLGSTDVHTGFNRLAVYPPHVPLLSFNFMWEGICYTAFPLLAQLGSQSSNYGFGLASRMLNDRLDAFIKDLVLRTFSRSLSEPLCTIFVDDLIYATPTCIATLTHDEAEQLTENEFGIGGCSLEKHLLGTTRTLLGWTYDIPTMSFTITTKQFLKLLALVFHAYPTLQIFQPISLLYLQKLSSYMIRTAEAIPTLAAFSRGASANMSSYFRLQGSDLYRLSVRLYHDILFWREYLTLAFEYPYLLTGNISTPPLLAYAIRNGVRETDKERGARQASSADIVLYTDACTGEEGSFENGLGAYIYPDSTYFPNGAAGRTSISELRRVMNHDGKYVKIHINILEYIATFWAIRCLVELIQSKVTTISSADRATSLHIHVFSDNTSSLSWLRCRTNKIPLILFLSQEIARLQWNFQLLVTHSFIPGSENVHADAESRNFQGSDCEKYRALHSQCQPLLLPGALLNSWKTSILRQADTYSFHHQAQM
jgi:hypothetical protein